MIEAPDWNITAQSKRPGVIEVTWPNYQPTDDEISQNLSQVVKYEAVCVSQKNGEIVNTDSFAGDTKAIFTNLKYGEYTVYVLAYLGDSPNTSLTNWKKDARRSRSVNLKSKQGCKYEYMSIASLRYGIVLTSK